MQCTHSAHTVHAVCMQCTCSAHAVHMQCTCSVYAVHIQGAYRLDCGHECLAVAVSNVQADGTHAGTARDDLVQLAQVGLQYA